MNLIFSTSLSLLVLTTISSAYADCNENIDQFFEKHSPVTKEITISGHYPKKSSSGEFKNCELSIKKLESGLYPTWEVGKLDPSNGDGGGIWPFGSYPTVQPRTDNYRSVRLYTCEGNENGFSMNFIHKDKSGWYRTHRNSMSITQIDVETFEVSMRDGQGRGAITCLGTLTEKQ